MRCDKLHINVFLYKLNLRLDAVFIGVIILTDNSIQFDRWKVAT